MTDISAPTTLERIASWACGLRFEDIPERVIHKAKLQMLSMLAAVYSGYPTRAARAIREVALASRARGRATVLPGGDTTSPTAAAMANAAASMALDYDDYLFMGHTGHSAVLGSLALAQEMGLGGRDLLRAQIAADEVGGRLGASVILGPQNGQLWTHIHAPAAACAGALLLGLDPAACAQAMALALYQPPMAMWPGFLGPDSKLLSAACPTRDGLLAARLASWGLTGPVDILDVRRGFGDHFAYQFLPQMLTGFGKTWVTDSLCFKIYPGCAYIDSAIDALLKAADHFRADHGRAIEPADIVSISVRTGMLGAELERLSGGRRWPRLSPVRINFSIPLSLAVALRAGRLTPAELDEEALRESADEIYALADKVEVRHDWSMTLEMLERMSQAVPLSELLAELDLRQLLELRSELGRQFGGVLDIKPRDLLRISAFLWSRAPNLVRQAGRAARNGIGRLVADEAEGGRGFDLANARLESASMPLSAAVAIEVAGGDVYEAAVDLPRGSAGRDPAETRGLVRKKFRAQAARWLPEDRVERALDKIDRLEDLPEIDSLTAELIVDQD
ncbi:MAG: MmgE/PrpD family protein [Deltaproteobacteria bacterium]|nr:MmgE/PrpD family protein [Deltaproteobacteria bacterium]